MATKQIIDILDITSLVWRNKWKFLGCVLISIAICIAVSFLATKKFRAEALLMPVTTDYSRPALPQELVNLGSLAGLSLDQADTRTEEAIAILESKYFIRDFIQNEDLMPLLYPNSMKSSAVRLQLLSEPSINDAVEFFRSSVRSVRRVPNGDMLRLSIEWSDPVVAVIWVERQVQRLNETLRTRAIETAGLSIDYLQQKADETSNVELRQMIFQLIQDQIRSIMLAKVQPDYAFRVIDPPFVSDLDDYVVPNRILYALFGIFSGAIFGLIVIYHKSERR